MNTKSGTGMVKSGGCGCGGGGSSAPAKCGCGGGGCSSCQSMDFVRPNFFAGQLLTEEDLQSLNNYIVAKNRLHNQRLFGAGVVCGLEVTCNPCGGGSVVVNPGYALDCCGNDITVACAQTLDINQMVRDLRRDMLGGYDCGDPCAESKQAPKKNEPPENIAGFDPATGMKIPAPTAAGSAVRSPTYDMVPAEPAEVELVRHFCLYINYCEQKTDPVSPYATDEPCGFQSCEPTRVHEGFRFELRCPQPKEEPDDFASRIGKCRKDAIASEKFEADFAHLEARGERFISAEEAIAKAPVPEFNAAHAKTLVDSTAKLKALLSRASTSAKLDKEKKNEAIISTDAKLPLPEIFDATALVAASAARFYARPVPSQTELIEKKLVVQADLEEARGMLSQLDVVRQAIDTTTVPLELDREYALALMDVSIGFPINANGIDLSTNQQYRLLAEQVVITPKLYAAYNDSITSNRESLYEMVESSPARVSCQLPKQIREINVKNQQGNEFQKGDMIVQGYAIRHMADTYRAHLLDCLCTSINPPCQPCDDMGVLLACIEVKDCEVVSICNLERTFVLTGVALRYWFSIGRLGELIEQGCCPSRRTKTATDINSNIRNQYLVNPSTAEFRKGGSFVTGAYAISDVAALARASGGNLLNEYASRFAARFVPARETVTTTPMPGQAVQPAPAAMSQKEIREAVNSALSEAPTRDPLLAELNKNLEARIAEMRTERAAFEAEIKERLAKAAAPAPAPAAPAPAPVAPAPVAPAPAVPAAPAPAAPAPVAPAPAVPAPAAPAAEKTEKTPTKRAVKKSARKPKASDSEGGK